MVSNAIIRIIPWTTGKSFVTIDLNINCPIPGQANIVSTTTDPPISQGMLKNSKTKLSNIMKYIVELPDGDLKEQLNKIHKPYDKENSNLFYLFELT